MGLRDIAEADLAFILEDADTGFGWPITVTDPDENSAELTGFSNDIAQVIDPETGQAVSGRLATATLRISSLTAAGFSMPQGIADTSVKPWLITFNDINGNSFTFKILQSNPDRAIGVVSLVLEIYG
jgi:hypothetical protein